jgi:hypothetical protein
MAEVSRVGEVRSSTRCWRLRRDSSGSCPTPWSALRAPTLPDILRIKAWLVLDRNATRDYLDVVALADRLGERAAAGVLLQLDDYYADQLGEGGMRVATQVAKQLAEPLPYDLDSVDLEHYRRLAPRWRRWVNVADASRRLASAMLDRAVAPGGDREGGER